MSGLTGKVMQVPNLHTVTLLEVCVINQIKCIGPSLSITVHLDQV